MRVVVLVSSLLFAAAAQAAPPIPIRIGITTILSGPTADRGQSEQYGAQLALNEINEAGGVLGRPLEAYYADNACKPAVGLPATRRLIEQEHTPVVIGALCTPVTHAIMPLVEKDRTPLVIATSAGQDFVDASGIGGNQYAFKTIPSEVDIALGLTRWLKSQNVKSIAIVADAGRFTEANAIAMAKAAQDAGVKVTSQQTLPQQGADLSAVVQKINAGAPDQVAAMLGPSTAGFFRAYATSGAKAPVTGRYDFKAALDAERAVSKTPPALTGAAVFTTAFQKPGVQKFVKAYEAHYGLQPTQRPFFVYEAVYLVADAIRRAGSDQPAAIEKALKTTTMPSALGGTYAPDAHNHAHTPIQIVGMRDGRPVVIAVE
jgi:branched-chain amino acid transport system substrate-binding protein